MRTSVEQGEGIRRCCSPWERHTFRGTEATIRMTFRGDPRSATCDDLEDRVGEEAVGLAVDGDGGVGVGGLDEAEDLPVGLVVPVLPVVDAVRALDPQVG